MLPSTTLEQLKIHFYKETEAFVFWIHRHSIQSLLVKTDTRGSRINLETVLKGVHGGGGKDTYTVRGSGTLHTE